MKMSAAYKPNTDVYSKVIHGNVHLLKSGANNIYELNETAAVIWSCVQKKNTVQQIVQKIRTMFVVSPSRAHHDVSSFISEFYKLGLINKLI